MRPHLKNGTRSLGAKFGHAKTGIEKTGIMRTKFTNPCVIGTHLGSVIFWHSNKFTACQNIEFIRVQHQPANRKVGWGDAFPKGVNRLACWRININQTGMFARPPANHAAFDIGFKIDAKGNAVTNIGSLGTMNQTNG